MRMSQPASRGACPGVADPMSTGDGLLARLGCVAPIPAASFLTLCEASRMQGNGIIEVTQRGNLQFRGLTVTSASRFARQVRSLGLGDPADSRVIGSPLSGLDALEDLDTRHWQAHVRRSVDFASVGPKVSVAIDGGGKLHLDGVRCDVRLRASHGAFHLALGGDARSALSVGWLQPQDCVVTIERLLALMAALGGAARARDLIAASGGGESLRLALGLDSGVPPAPRPAAEPVGTHALKEAYRALGPGTAAAGCAHAAPGSAHAAPGAARAAPGPAPAAPGPAPAAPGPAPAAPEWPPAAPSILSAVPGSAVALGFALPFGHSTADTLQHLAREAAARGADSIRPAPGRALLVIGLSRADAQDLANIAAAHGLVVHPDDPRRHIVACTGSPGCASASLPTRELGPAIARIAGSFLDGSVTIHLSGCAKGCALPGHASLTFSGPDRLIIDGSAGDTADGLCPADRILEGIKRLKVEREQHAGSSAELLSRLGRARIVELLQRGTSGG
jgi:precorrin-3B synthase